MDTHRQMAVRSRSGERQNLGAVRSFLGKKWAGQLYTKNTDGAVTYKVCLFSLCCDTHDIHYNKKLCRRI